MQSAETALTQRLAELESRPVSAGGGDLRKIRRERNELKDAVKSFEAELTQIQMDTKMLAEDRDNFKLLYEQVRATHTHTHTHGLMAKFFFWCVGQ